MKKINKQGFTLVELLTVIVILAILILLALPNVLKIMNNAKKNAYAQATASIVKGAKNYYVVSSFDGNFNGGECTYGETNTCKDIISIDGKIPDSGEINIDKVGLVNGYVIYDDTTYVIVNDKVKTITGEYIKIEKVEDLITISNNVNNGNTYEGEKLELFSNIDFTDVNSYRNSEDKSYGDINGDGEITSLITELQTGTGFMPIGNRVDGENMRIFKGNFDGNNHIISHLYSNYPEANYVGLFGIVESAVIKNITISNSYIKGGGAVGTIGFSSNYSLIKNILSKNNSYISNIGYKGSIVGQLIDSEVSNCTSDSLTINNSEITSQEKNIGGIVGYANNSTINNNTNGGNVNSQNKYIGGIIGYANNSTINNNTNKAKIVSTNYAVGGIVGILEKSIVSNNLNFGEIIGEIKWIGGIVGFSDTSTGLKAVVNGNINNGNINTINGAFRVGGIIGNGNSGIQIYNNINNGDVDALGNGTNSNIYGAGGIVGTISINLNNTEYEESYVYNCINAGNVKGRVSASGVIGNIYTGTAGSNFVNNVYNTGNITATNYASGIVGVIGDTIVSEEYLPNLINFAYNTGTINGEKASGLSGSNIGLSNAISIGNLEGINNYGITSNANEFITFTNNYYLSSYSSNYGTSIDKSNVNKSFYQNLLNNGFWNFDEELPRLYKVVLKVNTDKTVTVSKTNEILE